MIISQPIKKIASLVLLLMFFATGYAQTVRYVKAGGTGNGSSWAKASGDLQDMINKSSTNHQVWVATGTYKPTRNADDLSRVAPVDRINSFVLKKDVLVFGGFAGTETSLSQRVLTGSNFSVLDGNIGNTSVSHDNAYHVVISAGPMGNAELNGFEIINGFANNNSYVGVNRNNVFNEYGGGIACLAGSPKFSNLVLRNNYAYWGGGIYGLTNNSQFYNLQIFSNSAKGAGGIYLDESSPTILNSRITGNTATGNGGAMYNYSGSSPTMVSVLISGNTAGTKGAGIYNNVNSNPNLINLTIAGNKATGGEVLFNENNSVTSIKNCVILGNSGGVGNYSGGGTSTNYSVVQGFAANTAKNILADDIKPSFIGAPDFSTAPFNNGNYRLAADSELINKGSNALLPAGSTIDVDGKGRINSSVVDLGAYEGQLSIRYVKPVASGNGSGSSWANASADLQLMLNQSGVGEIVFVAGGNYKPIRRANDLNTITLNNRDNAFVMKNGVKLYGGFAGTETSLTDRDLSIKANASILDGNIGDVTRRDDNAFHVFICLSQDATTMVDGFHMINGNANVSGQPGDFRVSNEDIYRDAGGGLYLQKSKADFKNVIISGNVSELWGGGMFVLGGNPKITNTQITGNTCYYGAGVYSTVYGSPIFTNATISGNNGAGLEARNGSPEFYNCVIWGNSQGLAGPISVVKNSLVQGMSGSVSNQNLDGNANPRFMNAPANINAPFVGGDYSLQQGSPLINSGSNIFLTEGISTDLNSNIRIQRGTVDIGAFESPYSAIAKDANGIIYVKENGNGDGSGRNWANAISDLQVAINLAGVSQVWVAGGNYKPIRRGDALGSVSPPDRNNSFVLQKDVKIYGGFAGTETSLAQRDLSKTANKSILDGNIGDVAVDTDNTYHVVISAGDVGTTILDGFTIQNGNANSAGTGLTVNGVSLGNGNGGGMYNATSSPTYKNLVITNNKSSNSGAGVVNAYQTVKFDNVTITKNTTNGFGGGMENYFADIEFINCKVTDNNARTDGGGIANYRSAAKFINVDILKNTSGQDGGGIFSKESDILVSKSKLNNNSSRRFGGAMELSKGSSTVSELTINGNSAKYGGGIATSYATVSITACEITANTSEADGGGIYGYGNSVIKIVNVTVARNNSLSNSGGSIGIVTGTRLDVKNSVISENSSGLYADAGAYIEALSHTVFQGLGTAMSEWDPKFVDAANGNYRLQNNSPLINQGNNSFLPPEITKDLAGNNRIMDNTIDIGAYEYPDNTSPDMNGIIYVKQNGNGDLSGRNWANATNDLQKAIEANGVKQVWVAKGSYFPIRRAGASNFVSLNDRDNAFVLKKDIKIYGGFAGTETSLAQRDLTKTANKSILDGNIGDVTVDTDNAHHVVISAGDVGIAVLDGFTIQNGNANASGGITVNGTGVGKGNGGGIYNATSSPTYKNLVITNNKSSASGAGVVNAYRPVKFDYVTITKNTTSGFGAGMENYYADIEFTNSKVIENTAGSDGGGVSNYQSAAKFINAEISKNTAERSGGGIYSQESNMIVSKSKLNNNVCTNRNGGAIYIQNSSSSINESIIVGNSAVFGGGIYVTYSTVNIIACQVTSNTSQLRGGGVFGDNSSNLQLVNVTVARNGAAINGGGGIGIEQNTKLDIKNSVVSQNSSGLYKGFGVSIESLSNTVFQGLGNAMSEWDPKFVDAANGNYRLQNDSPLINQGNNSFLPTTYDKDLAGNDRIISGTIDIGAYENQIVTLPVSLMNFTAKAVNQTTELTWTTTSESNNMHFVIARSTDGVNFVELGIKAGAGDSSQPFIYSFRDQNPAKGQNYYRLSQVDIDGQTTELGIRSIKFDMGIEAKVSVYPNPITETINIYLPEYSGDKLGIRLADAGGKTLLNQYVFAISQNNWQLRLNKKLASGFYFLNLKTADGLNKTVKLIAE